MKKIGFSKGLVLLTCLLVFGTLLCSKRIVNAESNENDFFIDQNILFGYNGNGGEVEIPDTVVHISSRAFYNNDKITKITLPSGVKIIESETFKGCVNLKEVSLNQVNIISSEAFYGCSSLTEITIPTSVQYISPRAFSHCSSLMKFNVMEGSEKFSSVDGVLFAKESNIFYNYSTWPEYINHGNVNLLVAYPGGKKGDYIIPENAVYTEYAFEGSEGLTGITINKQTKHVTIGMFKDCVNLTNVTFSDGVTHFDDNAFEGCVSINSIQMPNTLQSIGMEAFKGCTGLSGIDIKSRVSSIGKGAFSGCIKLKSFKVDKANKEYSAKDGVLYNKKQTELILCPTGKSEEVKFASNVNAIKEDAFQGCMNLTKITMPDRITKIGEAAFKDCKGLTKVKLSESLTIIPFNLFEGCSSLTKVEIPGYVETIYDEAFLGCKSIVKMIIPESVTSIFANSFGDCDKLVIYGDKNSYVQKYAKRHKLRFTKIITNPVKLQLTITSSLKKSAKLSWKRAAKAKGYVIQMSTKKNGGFQTITNIKNGKKLNLNKGGLKSGETYYFRARSYKVVNKKTYYGKYSDVVSMKVK